MGGWEEERRGEERKTGGEEERKRAGVWLGGDSITISNLVTILIS